MTVLYVLDVPEYAPLAACAEAQDGCRVERCGDYYRISTDGVLTLERRATGLGPAVWFGALVAGYEGVLTEFSDTRLTLAPQSQKGST